MHYDLFRTLDPKCKTLLAKNAFIYNIFAVATTVCKKNNVACVMFAINISFVFLPLLATEAGQTLLEVIVFKISALVDVATPVVTGNVKYLNRSLESASRFERLV